MPRCGNCGTRLVCFDEHCPTCGKFDIRENYPGEYDQEMRDNEHMLNEIESEADDDTA